MAVIIFMGATEQITGTYLLQIWRSEKISHAELYAVGKWSGWNYPASCITWGSLSLPLACSANSFERDLTSMGQFIVQFIWEGTQVLYITLCIPSIPFLCPNMSPLRVCMILFSPLQIFYSSFTGHSIDPQCSYTACPKKTVHRRQSPM